MADEGRASGGGDLEPGSVLFGEYEVLGSLGVGGMGAVYRARHRSLGELRALKVMRPEMVGHASGLQLFLREARAMLQVQHDAVARCHDLLRDGDRYFLVAELVEGRPLSDILAERPLAPQMVAALRDRLAAGLAAMHARGVVHRDLSPDNVLLPGDDPARAKVIDFGIARLDDGQSTVVGFKGKLAYASPEQLGLYGGEVDGRSDLFSLGLVLVEAASGQRPDAGRTLAAAVEARQRKVRIPEHLPPDLRHDLGRMLEPDPSRRVASAEALLASHTPTLAAAGPLPGAPRRAFRRAAVGALLVSLVGGGLVLATRLPGFGPRAEQPEHAGDRAEPAATGSSASEPAPAARERDRPEPGSDLAPADRPEARPVAEERVTRDPARDAVAEAERAPLWRSPVGAESKLTLLVDPPDARVLLDGRRLLPTSEDTFEALVRSGRHEIRVVAPGHAPHAQTLEVRPGLSSLMTVRLEAAGG